VSDAWTVRRVLEWTAKDLAGLGIPTARLDAELLLSHALGCDRVRLYMDLTRPLDAAELATVRELVKRRRKREPVAYILGHKEFYKRRFVVTRDVLVPRPETELLVDRALEILPASDPREHARALDLCTGSGVVAITLALERPELGVDGADLAAAALTIARANAQALGAGERVQWYEGDLFEALPGRTAYALITANPPYVADGVLAELAPEVREHEPRLALSGGDDGLAVIRRLCAQAPEWLLSGGSLLFEHGFDQGERVLALLQSDARWEAVRSHKDLAGADRIAEARRR
jgi:release factor glutamine methyltransferase